MKSDINQELIKAITEHNVENVRSCLQNGADPNYTWTHNQESNLGLSTLQPTTPLRLLIFAISDCLLSEGDLTQHYEIAKILLENNAHPEPAMMLAIQRYGKYKEPEKPSMFDNIYRLISEAYSEQ
jgi:hypothetical protein